MQSRGGRRAGPASCGTLVPGTHAPRDSSFLADPSEEGPSFSAMGRTLAPASRPLEATCLDPGRDEEILGDLPPEVLSTFYETCSCLEVEPVF